MRDIHKNPMFYYLLAPVLIGLWPLLAWAVYLPRAEQSWEEERALYTDAQSAILDILKYDPERLIVGEGKNPGKFTYAEAVDRVANLCGIRSSNYKLNSGNVITSGSKKSQQARATLTDVDIVQAAKFLSTVQSTWVNLKCEKVKLSKKKGLPDKWDVDLSLWYDY